MLRILFLFLLGTSQAFAKPTWLVVTEHFPPYNYEVDGDITGYSAELIRNLLDSAELDYEMQLLPWTRAMTTATSHPNTMIFSIVKSANRLDNYIWFGPIQSIDIYRWSTTDVLDQRSRHVILRGAVVGETLVKNKMVVPEQILEIDTAVQAVGMLLKERAEAIYIAENMWFEIKAKFSEDELAPMKRGPLVKSVPLYFAVNPHSSARDVDTLRRVFPLVVTSQYKNDLALKYGLRPTGLMAGNH